MRSKLAFLSLGALLLAGGLSAQTALPKAAKKYPNLVGTPSAAVCADIIAGRANHAKGTKGVHAAGPKLNKGAKARAKKAKVRKVAALKACKALKQARIKKGK